MTTNEDRAERIDLILAAIDEESPVDVLIDLLVDAMHWCHLHGSHTGFAHVLAIASQRFATEIEPPVFSLTCAHCDAGQGIPTEAEALAQGWNRIQDTDLPEATHLGICPDCQREEEG